MSRRNCASTLLGAWACDSKWLSRAIAAVQAGTWKPRDSSDPPESPLYSMEGLNHDVATLYITGHMSKGRDSFGGASTVDTRRAIRAAAADPNVRSVLLIIDSPGGTVAGTADLADDIAAVNAKKPVYAYIEDMGCSAAYWIASQCQQVWANSSALIGSIGTYTVLSDYSEQNSQIGISYTVISSAEYKGLGADDRVTDKLVQDTRREIMELNAVFLAAVSKGRTLAGDALARISTGQAWVSTIAKGLGLVDDVISIDEAHRRIAMNSHGAVLAQASNSELFSIWKTTSDAEMRQAIVEERARRSGCSPLTIESAWHVSTVAWKPAPAAADRYHEARAACEHKITDTGSFISRAAHVADATLRRLHLTPPPLESQSHASWKRWAQAVAALEVQHFPRLLDSFANEKTFAAARVAELMGQFHRG